MSGDGGNRDSGASGAGGLIASDAAWRLLDRPLTDEDLREQTRHVALPREEARERGTSVLAFELGAELLGLPAEVIAGVRHPVPVHRIPHRTNDVIRGLSNVGGELVLCARLDRLLELPAPAGPAAAGADEEEDGEDERRMIVLGPASGRWVFPVARVLGVVGVEPGAERPPPMTIDLALTSFTTSLIPVEGRVAALLDAPRVVSALEAALT